MLGMTALMDWKLRMVSVTLLGSQTPNSSCDDCPHGGIDDQQEQEISPGLSHEQEAPLSVAFAVGMFSGSQTWKRRLRWRWRRSCHQREKEELWPLLRASLDSLIERQTAVSVSWRKTQDDEFLF